MAQKRQRIICTAYDKAKMHDFKVLQKNKLPLRKGIKKKLDSNFQNVEKLHAYSKLSKKATDDKNTPLGSNLFVIVRT